MSYNFLGVNMKHEPVFKALRWAVAALAVVLTSLSFVQTAHAFALLGPYADWMAETNDYHQDGDIGGPMNLGEEYRWNVPVITYAFDDSFVNYFGTNGVAAVEGAIQILNELPEASDIVLTNFPTDTRRANAQAGDLFVFDLKSTALALLVEQLGLTQPTRNILDLQGWDPALMQLMFCGNSSCSNFAYFPGLVIQRNFDPATVQASFAINGLSYECEVETDPYLPLNYVGEFPIDPQQSPNSAVADAFSHLYQGLPAGCFYTGLTRDDVGGLCYLLSATNLNWESLPNDVIFTGGRAHANKRLRGAWRPGVEKITFAPQPRNRRGKFKTAVFKFTAFYVTNGVVSPQRAKRIVSQPDIVFAAADTYLADSNSPMFLRTGTDQWTNNATENGNPGGAGPGVIKSPIRITFDELGPHINSGAYFNPPELVNHGWASFDMSTNPPIIYPQNTGQTNLLVRLRLYDTNTLPWTEINSTLFDVPVAFGGQAALQTSTNQTDWTSLITVTNAGSIVRWDYFGTNSPVSFRVLPENF